MVDLSWGGRCRSQSAPVAQGRLEASHAPRALPPQQRPARLQKRRRLSLQHRAACSAAAPAEAAPPPTARQRDGLQGSFSYKQLRLLPVSQAWGAGPARKQGRCSSVPHAALAGLCHTWAGRLVAVGPPLLPPSGKPVPPAPSHGTLTSSELHPGIHCPAPCTPADPSAGAGAPPAPPAHPRPPRPAGVK